MGLNTTPSANRLHIGIFGKVNSGKSTFINAFTGQDVSIVSDIAGTTTDVVSKAMEIPQLGPCVMIDTAGFGDGTALGDARAEKTLQAAGKCDIAIFVIADDGITELLFGEEEQSWYKLLIEKKIPVVCIVNSFLNYETAKTRTETLIKYLKKPPVIIDAKTGYGIEQAKIELMRSIPEDFELPYITGNLVEAGDLVMLVMPQDAQAPKGRLILPQVQTIRELLDKNCTIVSVVPEQMKHTFEQLKNPPKLIITDSQVFQMVYECKPKESMLTSFSILFAAYKGDLSYYIKSAKTIERLNEKAKILIAECCTHAPLSEDIGRVKIPNMLRKRFGEGLSVDIVSGADFPNDLSEYDLIIQCGGCMFNRRYILGRINKAKEQNVPMTNYGIVIAYLSGILDKINLS